MNVDMILDGNILTIKSGKTTIIASTEGDKAVPRKEDIKIGLNVCKKR